MKRISYLVSSALLSGMLFAAPAFVHAADTVTPKAVMENYVNLAYTNFTDALNTAKVLQEKVNAFIAAILKNIDPIVLKIAIDDADDANIFTDALKIGDQRAHAADQ